MSDIGLMMAMAGVVLLVFGGISVLSNNYTLNGIKARTVGNGQHGTARWATKKEIQQTYGQHRQEKDHRLGGQR